MKLLSVSIVLAWAALAFVGCGDGGASTEASAAAARAGDKQARRIPLGTPAQAASRATATVPQGPSSSSLLVRDVIQGTGDLAETGEILVVRYVAGIYETGEKLESTGSRPPGFLLGGGAWSYGFEEGLVGMRVGGRRALIFPTTPAELPPGSKLGDTLVYVVDLLEISQPGGQQSF